MLFTGPIGDWVSRIGLIPAHRAVATQALQSGAVVLVFPGGVYDAYRPTLRANVVDFNGRTGYVATARWAGMSPMRDTQSPMGPVNNASCPNVSTGRS
ncbi:hypothetical protein A6B34_02610 [Mycolicibacterium monacense]|nr:hypothetical protein A6B34_02610 [Mycolicibacterium monacense]